MKHHLFLIALLGCAVIFSSSSCGKTDVTPAYVHIEYNDVNNCIDITNFNAVHETNLDVEELNSLTQQNFTHVNVYVNGNNLGCWELPCNVPVLDITEGDSVSLVVLPCFRKTGMSNTIQGYPFLNALKQTVLLTRGKTYNVSEKPMQYIYSSYAHIPFMETFANSSDFTPSDSVNNNLNFTPTVIEERQVGAITLNSQNGLSFDVTSSYITVPIYNYYVYLELTYKIESSMEIGLKLSTATYPNTVHQLGGIYATDEWKTIYFDLSSVIQSYNATSSTLTAIKLILTGMGDAGKDTHFYIDNMKVIYERSA